MSEIESVVAQIRKNRDTYVSELISYLEIPSISTLPSNKGDVERAAHWLASQLRNIGIERVELVPTEGHPIVIGEWLKAPAGSPTMLIYGHYDVQPVDPLNEWQTPPFSPDIRGDEIYARGAADMKGQGHALLKSLEAWITCTGTLPVNVKVLFEGEEEVGSPHVKAFLQTHRERLAATYSLNCDSGIDAIDKPTITRGLRGMIAFELKVRVSSSDLHSGGYGGVVPNSAVVLCELIAGMHDTEGRVTLKGFYDDVRKVSEEERADLARFGMSDEEWKNYAGVKQLYGEKGFSSDERAGARPTLEVNGISAGFEGEGMKTIIPAAAVAKISTRTVPYQNHDQIEASLREYLSNNAPAYVDWELKRLASGPYALMERESPLLDAASLAYEDTYGKKPYTTLDGGSVPIVAIIKETLGLETVMIGCALSGCHAHAPNEKLHLPTYMKGIEVYARFLARIGQQGSPKL